MHPVSTTEDISRLARLCGAVADAPEAEDEGTAEAILRTLRDSAPAPTIAEALEALKPPARFNPEMVPLDLTDAEIDESFAYFDTEDYRIGYDAFLKKKKPKFVGK